MLSSFKEILLNLVIKRITNRFFMFKNLQTKSQLNKGRRFLKLNKQENILDLYYNKHLKQKDIANIVGVSKQYVSKVVNSDSRCKKEKQLRKDKNAITRKDYMKGYFKNYVRLKKEDNSYEQLKALQYQDSLELSYFLHKYKPFWIWINIAGVLGLLPKRRNLLCVKKLILMLLRKINMTM